MEIDDYQPAQGLQGGLRLTCVQKPRIRTDGMRWFACVLTRIHIFAAARRSEAKGLADQRCASMGGTPMLYWAVVFLVIALVAALFGFGGIAAAAVGIAKFLFFLFVVIFVVLLVMGLMRRRSF